MPTSRLYSLAGFFIGESVADVKWIKITTNIFDDEKIKLIERLPEGDTMLIVWLKLLTLAGKRNDSGIVYITRDIPYTPETLSDIMNRDSKIIMLALNTFKTFDMIDIVDDFIHIVNWEKHQNIEGLDKIREQNKLRQRRHRDKQIESNVMSRDSNAIDKTRIDKKRKKDNVSEKTDSTHIQIIEYLNTKAKKNYKHTTNETNRVIQTRLKDFTVQDFYTVIDKKCKQWRNTEMDKYLRPSTLFGTKFEGYLNEKDESEPFEKEADIMFPSLHEGIK